MGLFHRKPKSTAYDLVKQTKKENFTFLNETVKHGQTVFAGDSITEIYNLTDLYWEFTEKTGQAVYNRGISGDTSDRLLERFSENVLCITPHNLVLLIGTNDLGLGFAPAQIEANVRKILEETKAQCPEANVILQSVYPVRRSICPSMVGRRNNADVQKTNALLRPLAEEFGITYADVYPALCATDGSIDAAYSYDGLHLNAHGFAKVTEILLPLLK